MPVFSARFVRLSLVYLAVGFSLGAVLLVNKALGVYPPSWKLLPIHTEMLLMGWFVQLAIGVAFWILPRLPSATPRGNLRLIGLAFWLVNAGIVLVIVQVFVNIPGLILLGRLAELGGMLAFVSGSWNRVKSFRR